MAAREVNVIVFPGGFNLPLWVGIERGYFGAGGLDVRPHYTANSMEQLSGLIRGDWEIGLTGFDNVVAYQEGQGEATIDREPDLFVFMGGDSSFLRLVVQPDVRSYADLKGKALSVDALTTGFAFVLRGMLAKNGIAETDIQFERAGGVLQRFEALKAGKHAGTLLVTPFELLAQKAGLRLLQNASELFPHYQGVVGTARRGWAKDNGDVVTSFVRGYVNALAWLYERANRPAACALLAAKVPGMTAELALATCEVLLANDTGFDPQARLDIAGIKTVLELRSQYGRPQKVLTDTRKYDALSFYEQALQRP